MKKVLFITIISLVIASISAFPVLADKASPKLSLAFTDASDKPVNDETNSMLNNFVLASQELLDKASPILTKLVDKSSPQLFRLDKSSPQLMKEYEKACPILMGYSEGWVNLAKNIDGGSYTADIAGVDTTSVGQITISSDNSMTVITSIINLSQDMNQTIVMTYDKNNGDWCIECNGDFGGAGGAIGCRGAYCVHTR